MCGAQVRGEGDITLSAWCDLVSQGYVIACVEHR